MHGHMNVKYFVYTALLSIFHFPLHMPITQLLLLLLLLL